MIFYTVENYYKTPRTDKNGYINHYYILQLNTLTNTDEVVFITDNKYDRELKDWVDKGYSNKKIILKLSVDNIFNIPQNEYVKKYIREKYIERMKKKKSDYFDDFHLYRADVKNNGETIGWTIYKA